MIIETASAQDIAKVRIERVNVIDRGEALDNLGKLLVVGCLTELHLRATIRRGGYGLRNANPNANSETKQHRRHKERG